MSGGLSPLAGKTSFRKRYPPHKMGELKKACCHMKVMQNSSKSYKSSYILSSRRTTNDPLRIWWVLSKATISHKNALVIANVLKVRTSLAVIVVVVASINTGVRADSGRAYCASLACKLTITAGRSCGLRLSNVRLGKLLLMVLTYACG